MRSVKLIRSLILGDNLHDPLLLYQNHHDHQHTHDSEYEGIEKENRCRLHPCLFFLPTHETIHDTRKLAAIARDMGMNFAPDSSLTYIIFAWPPSSPSSSSSSSSPLPPSPLTTIPLPFPSLSSASTSHLRRFARISKGLFTLVACNIAESIHHLPPSSSSHAVSLFACLSGEKIQDMEALARALTGNGWALFKTTADGGDSFVFRKVERDVVKVRWSKGAEYCRVREVRLPSLDFEQAPRRIFHYILLMTDGLFYLA